MQGLLFPAYQKFYSALSSLERFRKEANFFDNISCLDTFFSEYRNVTFVIQSQLKHTEYFEKYERHRDEYLNDHWFVEKRNEVTKQQPFCFQKRINFSVYTPSEKIAIMEKQFTLEDDVPFDSLKDEIKEFFNNLPMEEIFFSTVYFFTENGNETDLFGRIFAGISAMKNFLEALSHDINDQCDLCKDLKQKIDRMAITNMPRDFLFADDYVYYKKTNQFEKAARLAMTLSQNGEKTISRRPLSDLFNPNQPDYDGTPFGKFTMMHVLIRAINPAADIMPAIMIVYGDNTFDLDAFQADIKTTLYRKINEVAKVIETEEVKEVCFVALYTVCSFERDIPVYSKERIKSAVSDILVVSSINCDLAEKEYVFDGEKIADPQYIGYILRNELKNELVVSKLNMSPVWQAFNKRHKADS